MVASQTLQHEDKHELNFSSESLNSGSVKRSAGLRNQRKQTQIFKKRQREKRDTKTYRGDNKSSSAFIPKRKLYTAMSQVAVYKHFDCVFYQ